MDRVEFINRYGQRQTEEGWFHFEYEIGWKFYSNEPKCYAGDHLDLKTEKRCELWCGEDQCTLKNPAEPNTDKRMLQSEPPLAGRDISDPDYEQIDRKPVPTSNGRSLMNGGTLTNAEGEALEIPTLTIQTTNDLVAPDILLQYYLDMVSDIMDVYQARPRPYVNLVQVDVAETVLEKAEPIQLNAKIEKGVGYPYHYNVTDKAKIELKPPAAIKITEVPKRGNMKMKANGKEKVLQVGDVVPAEQMDSFTYDQLDEQEHK
jgi:hypothetical protein